MSFEARYHGDCDHCDERIEPGEEVCYDDAGCLVHVACLEPREKATVACSRCFLVHAGECF